MRETIDVPRGELRSVSSAGLVNWVRRTFAGRSPSARVIAPSVVCLGASLEVIDRQVPDHGSPVASGQAEANVPLRSAPSLAGRLNGIAWAVVVQASFGASTVLRREFPLIVVPVSS